MNVELLERIIQVIDEEPRRLEMSYWAVSEEVKRKISSGEREQLFDPPCGTAACIYGWAQLLTEGEFHDLDEIQEWSDVLGASVLFDVSTEEARKLVLFNKWPAPFKEEYYQARLEYDARKAADVAIARIRQFIATETVSE